MQCWQALRMTNLKLWTTNTLTGNSRPVTEITLWICLSLLFLILLSFCLRVCVHRVFFEVAKIPMVHIDTLEEALTVL